LHREELHLQKLCNRGLRRIRIEEKDLELLLKNAESIYSPKLKVLGETILLLGFFLFVFSKRAQFFYFQNSAGKIGGTTREERVGGEGRSVSGTLRDKFHMSVQHLKKKGQNNYMCINKLINQ
jgi:hypothetical protein